MRNLNHPSRSNHPRGRCAVELSPTLLIACCTALCAMPWCRLGLVSCWKREMHDRARRAPIGEANRRPEATSILCSRARIKFRFSLTGELLSPAFLGTTMSLYSTTDLIVNQNNWELKWESQCMSKTSPDSQPYPFLAGNFVSRLRYK